MTDGEKRDLTHSEIRAALAKTVRSVPRYSVVPHTHWPAIHPCGRMSSSFMIHAVAT